MSPTRETAVANESVTIEPLKESQSPTTPGATRPWEVSRASEEVASLNRNAPLRASLARLPSDATASASRARELGREAARRTPPEERKKLFFEHDRLTQKMFTDGGLTRADERRLTYLRWNLDRLRDAEMGKQLDALEDVATMQERSAAQISQFLANVRTVQRSTGRR